MTAPANRGRRFSLGWWDHALAIRPDWISRRVEGVDSVATRVALRVGVLFGIPLLIVALGMTLANAIGSDADAATPAARFTSFDQTDRADQANLPPLETEQARRNYGYFTAGRLGKSAGFRPKKAWAHPTVVRDIIAGKIDRVLAGRSVAARRLASYTARDLRRMGVAQPRRLAGCTNGACYYDYLRDNATCSQWKTTHFGDGAVPDACHPGSNDWGSKNLSSLTIEQNIRVLSCTTGFVAAIYSGGSTLVLIASVTSVSSACALGWMAS